MKDLVDFAFLLPQVLTLGSPDEDPDEDPQDQDQDLDNDVAPGIEGRLEQASLQEFARSVTKRRSSIFLTSFLKVQCQTGGFPCYTCLTCFFKTQVHAATIVQSRMGE